MAGSSLLPYCRRDIISEHREFAYVESYNATRSNDPADWARSIRSARFRYTLYPRGNGEQLFDLLEDPDELQNIAQDPRHRSSKAELRDCLLEAVIAQDYPKSPRSLFQLGVH
jgi:arylsulfatase A-like enzyme